MLHAKMCESLSLRRYLSRSHIDQFQNILIALNRVTFMKDIIKLVMKERENYGKTKMSTENYRIYSSFTDDTSSMTYLRSMLLCKHMQKIFKQNG